MKNIAKSQKGFISIVEVVVIILLLAGVGYAGYRVMHKSSATKPASSNSSVTRSKAPGFITQATPAHGIDPKTGEAVNPATTFSKTEPVYVVLSVRNPQVGTKFEYVRYLNDKYLDHRSITTKKVTTNNVTLDWALKNKTGAAHPAGQYKVKLYTNGVYEQSVSYSVQ